MKIAKVVNNDLANGPGIRTSVFVSGCPIKCPGCHNPELQSFDVGTDLAEYVIDKVIASLKKDGVHRDLSILGGEPLADQNIDGVIYLCQRVKEALPDTNIWVWTGYDFRERFWFSRDKLHKKNFCDIMNTIDVVVDGPFVEALKPGEHLWRGSSNQHIIVLHSKNTEVHYGTGTATSPDELG